MNKILLTGGNGFIGSHVLEILVNNGYDVILLKRTTSDLSKIKFLDGKFSVCNMDIESEYLTLFQDNEIETIIHIATQYGLQMGFSSILETNVLFPLRLIENGKNNGLKYFINTDSFFSKSDTYNYLNHYSNSKKIFKNILIDISKDNIKVVNLQLEHVFGEKDNLAKFAPYILNKLINNAEELDLTKGDQKRDFIYVKDVAKAYLATLKEIDQFSSFEDFEIGTGRAISIREFVTNAKLISGSSSKLNFGRLPTRDGEFEESKANNNFLTQTKWFPEFNLQEALINTITFQK